MAMSTTITSDLLKAKIVTDDEVNAVVEVFMRDPTLILFQFASGHTLDAAAAVKEHAPAANAVADPDRTEKFRRGMVRTAILRARPTAP
jgi:hypothetical protein